MGPVTEIKGNMDQIKYKEILSNIMLMFANNKLEFGWIFQQENHPKHTEKSVKNRLVIKRISTIAGFKSKIYSP